MSDDRYTQHLHAADEPEFVRTPAVHYVLISGSGAPGTDAFYRKKASVAEMARDLHEGDSDPVVEIQYWYPTGSTPVDIADFYSVNPIPSLQYRVLAMVPANTTADDLAAARADAARASDMDEIRLFALPEQDVVQVMHHGPFAEEYGTLARLGRFAQGLGLHRSGPTMSSTWTASPGRPPSSPSARSFATPWHRCMTSGCWDEQSPHPHAGFSHGTPHSVAGSARTRPHQLVDRGLRAGHARLRRPLGRLPPPEPPRRSRGPPGHRTTWPRSSSTTPRNAYCGLAAGRVRRTGRRVTFS